MKGAIITMLIYLLAIIGEVLCVVKFFTSDFKPSYKREIIYGVSLITGLGIIVGYMDFSDTLQGDEKVIYNQVK